MNNSLITILFLCITSTAFSQNFPLDISNSQMKWKGKAAFSTYSLSGTLNPMSGRIIMKDSHLISGSITIDMNSLEAENESLEKHLRSEDFFDVEKYEVAEFHLLSHPSSSTCCNGQLTIKGITQAYNFPLTITTDEEIIKVVGVITIDRTDFGITFNSPNYFEKLKDQAIADEFELVIDLTFIKN